MFGKVARGYSQAGPGLLLRELILIILSMVVLVESRVVSMKIDQTDCVRSDPTVAAGVQ